MFSVPFVPPNANTAHDHTGCGHLIKKMFPSLPDLQQGFLPTISFNTKRPFLSPYYSPSYRSCFDSQTTNIIICTVIIILTTQASLFSHFATNLGLSSYSKAPRQSKKSQVHTSPSGYCRSDSSTYIVQYIQQVPLKFRPSYPNNTHTSSRQDTTQQTTTGGLCPTQLPRLQRPYSHSRLSRPWLITTRGTHLLHSQQPCLSLRELVPLAITIALLKPVAFHSYTDLPLTKSPKSTKSQLLPQVSPPPPAAVPPRLPCGAAPPRPQCSNKKRKSSRRSLLST